MDFITLSCPSCGGKLQISNDIDRFACSYCGQEHIVKRTGNIISLSPILEGIEGVKSGVDKTAAELALVRLEKELNYYIGMMYQMLDQNREKSLPIVTSFTFILSLLLVVVGIIVKSSSTSYIALAMSLICGIVIIPIMVENTRKKKRVKEQYPIIQNKIDAISWEIEKLKKLVSY